MQKLRINPRGAVAGPPKTFSWTSTPKNSPRCRASPSPPPPPRREILTQRSSTPTAYPSVSCLCQLTIYRCQVVKDERFIQSTFSVVSYSDASPSSSKPFSWFSDSWRVVRRFLAVLFLKISSLNVSSFCLNCSVLQCIFMERGRYWHQQLHRYCAFGSWWGEFATLSVSVYIIFFSRGRRDQSLLLHSSF